MEDLKLNCWNNDLRASVNTFEKIMNPMLEATLVLRLLYLVASPFSLLNILVFAILGLTLIPLLLINNFSVRNQQKVTLAVLEFHITILWLLAFFKIPEHNLVLCICSCVLTFFYEYSFIYSSEAAFLLTVKFLVQWYWSFVLSGAMSFTWEPAPLLCTLFCFISAQHYHSSTKNHSLSKFLALSEVQKSKQKLQLIIDLCHEGLVVISPNHTVELINSNLLVLLTTTEESIFGTLESLDYIPKGRIYFKDSTGGNFTSDLLEGFQLELNQEEVLGLVKANNCVLEVRLRKIPWDEGIAVALTFNNVEKTIELEKVNAENKCKSAFLRSMSHEFRTPANCILNISESLEKETLANTPKRLLKKIKFLKVSAYLFMNQVHNIIDYSRIVLGKFSLEKVEFSLRNLVSETYKFFETQFLHKKIRIIIRIDPSIPELIYTDPKKLQQVLVNLLSNSLKYTSKGFVELAATQVDASFVKFSVIDTGIGITQEKQQTIFLLFGGSCSDSESSGIGLGLNVSNMLVKELGSSTIKCRSQVGTGSEFSFKVLISEHEATDTNYEYIPDLVSKEISRPIEVKSMSIIGRRVYAPPRVLVVDDNDFNRMIVAAMLQTESIRFLEAKDGQEAVDFVLKHDGKGFPFKLVLMDCNMPVMDGWQASRKIHELHRSKVISKLPNIVALTAYSEPEEIKLSYESGMCLHLVKPCNQEVLLNTVSFFLSKEEESYFT